MPPDRFPCWSSRPAKPGLEVTSLLEDIAEGGLSTACGEPARAANVLDIAPEPASKTPPVSNTASKPSNTRDFEWKRLEFEGLFIVRCYLVMFNVRTEKVKGAAAAWDEPAGSE